MSDPLITVVIPTSRRPQYLPDAVRSALDGLDRTVEVIVVPNGPDTSWKESLAQFGSDTRVRVEPTDVPHANHARNYGMSLARGRYIRFLDDDDILYPGASKYQCNLLDATQADICSGAVELIDEKGDVFQLWEQPQTEDFTEAILTPLRITAINAHVFRRGALAGLLWNESIPLGQDTHWMHQLCQAREWSWARTECKAGAWRHHGGPRISASSRQSHHTKVAAQYLVQTILVLRAQGRLGTSRQAAAAAGLWHLVHGGFFMEPGYWADILRQTQKMFPATYPDVALYRSRFGKVIPPLLLETLMLPKRRLNHALRRRRYERGQFGAAVPP